MGNCKSDAGFPPGLDPNQCKSVFFCCCCCYVSPNFTDVNEKSAILIIPLSSESTSSSELLGSCSWDLLSSSSRSSQERTFAVRLVQTRTWLQADRAQLTF